jgi:hypothetical protein
MPTPTPPGLVGGELTDTSGQPDQPETPSLTSGSQSEGDPSFPPVEPPPNFGALSVEADGAPFPVAFGITTVYKTFTGRAFSPVAGVPDNGPDIAPHRLHKPFTMKRVSFVVQAVGGLPPVPSSYTGSDNEWLLDEVIGVSAPGTLPAGDQLHTVTGSYLYVLQNGIGVGDSYGSAANPMSNYAPEQNTLDPADFERLLGAARVTRYNGIAIDF